MRLRVVGRYDWPVVVSLRRVDVFLGDRPFQLVPEEGGHLGVSVDPDALAESPIQDEVVEVGYDSPYGRCVSERTFQRDGHTLVHVEYEHASQVALEGPDGELLATQTYRSDESWDGVGKFPEDIVEAFKCGQPMDEVAAAIKAGN